MQESSNEIYIRCSNAVALAQTMLRAKAVESVRLSDREEGLVVGTRTPVAVYQQLPQWMTEAYAQIHELRCSDDSLQALFSSLLQIHRGRV